MLRRTSALFLAALTATAVVYAKPIVGTHVRCLDSGARRIFQEGLNHSATVGRLADRIERSDVLVFVVTRLTDGPLVGRTQMLTAVPGTRYVMVTLDPRANSIDLVGRLAHELQHVAEIADAPDVKDANGVKALFKRIGWRRGAPETWETQAAVDTGQRASREAAERPSHVANLAQNGRPSAEHR